MRKKRETRRRIVAAAIRLFDERGYDGTTVAQIAAAADVDPKTFFNHFGSKDEVLLGDVVDRDMEALFAAIAQRRPDEGPGEVLARMVREYAALRRPKAPDRDPAELAAATRLVMSSPALQARSLQGMLDLQRRLADELVAAFPDELDPITAAAMVGALIGAVQQAGLASVRLGRSQDALWAAARRGAEVATHGLLAVPPPTDD